ncbi:MAG: endolytic transglycosylase MltG [Deltaproteobacteria bacterium]|nr:endolytic transglycosylase MltG [Deltaproteobacteria bacterium]
MKRKLIFGLVGLTFLLTGVLLASWLVLFSISPKAKEGQSKILLIKKGTGITGLAGQLTDEGLIGSRNLFVVLVGLTGQRGKIKAGEYELSPTMSPWQILEILVLGKVFIHRVTIPEGFTSKQIGLRLAQEGLISDKVFMSKVNDAAYAASLGMPGPTLEGYLFPDTYNLTRSLDEDDIIKLMTDRFKKAFARYQARTPPVNLTLRQAVILASIIEKETGQSEEKPRVASVFTNRLARDMPLQSDPTVIYGLNDYDGRLTKRQLTADTPYNTYTRKGLPPTPIANPGQSSLEAVFFPAKGKDLYFVSKNDGTHYFSRTLQEHNQAVTTYQKNRGQ